MGIKPKKSLGQNFLTDRNIIAKIAGLALPDLPIVEIGPGTGALTSDLLKIFPNLISIEIDERAIEFLMEKFPRSKHPGLKIIQQDILESDINSLFNSDYQVIGNIPYYISSQIFFKLYDSTPKLRLAVMTIQKDLAKRLIANKGSKDYGILTIAMALKGKCRIEFDISPGCFFPAPKVTSSVIVMEFRPVVGNLEFASVMKVVRAAFNQRRKVLRNALKPLYSGTEGGIDKFYENMIKFGLEPDKVLSSRAEQLEVHDFIQLNKALGK